MRQLISNCNRLAAAGSGSVPATIDDPFHASIMASHNRLVPLIVALPLFLQNIDSSAMATALPTIARSLNVEVLHLNLAITSYLLSLAVFLPLSGWLASRFGAKRVFCCAIACFATGSALCGIADSLTSLVLFRMLQGFGGAMMVPVGRLILIRRIEPSAMVAAMVWYTLPAAVGRLSGPLFGGLIVTWVSWRWIFLVGVPFGLVGIVLAMLFIEDDFDGTPPPAFDLKGFVLLALGLVGLLGGLETASKGLLPVWAAGLMAAGGALCVCIYALRSRRVDNPIVNLSNLRFATYRAAILGGSALFVAVGAAPFLLPLMFQLAFGLSPLDSGLLTIATALGSLATRPIVAPAIRRFGFRPVMMGAATLSGLCYMSYALFRPDTPHALMFAAMLFGGLVNAMGMVTLQTLGFSDVPKPLMSHATALSIMAQQVSVSFGVVLGASLVGAAAWLHGSAPGHLTVNDFSPAFVGIGMVALLSLLCFMQLDKDEGSKMR
ncbi:MAG: transporter [Ramlibacter sp.]|jgi:EmrB/QacA subfamily drug resistance transporter|nr:transporter [Ramlibacter sp.]